MVQKAPSLPSIADTGQLINATNSDWRAFLFAIMFFFIALIVFVIWREILAWKMTKSLDKMTDAMIALKIVIAEGHIRQELQDRRQGHQDERQGKQDTRQDRLDRRARFNEE